MKRFQRILVSTDFGSPSLAAVDLAADLAVTFDAALTVLHVVEIPALAYAGAEFSTDLITPFSEAAEKELAALKARLAPRVRRLEVECRIGFPAEEILGRAGALHADLIVTGTHGRRGLSRALLGSVAERVVRLAKVPVLTARAPE